MRSFLVCIFAVLLLALHASASITTNFTGFANNGYIPDNNVNGWADTRSLNVTEEAGFTVADVQVTLNISGGWNGDLYGYLVHDSGLVVLLDRVGSSTYSPYGYGNAGFTSVTLADDVSHTSIEFYGGTSTASGAWTQSGPYNSQDYNSLNGNLNTAFDGLSVNGNWTLFLSDRSPGDISQVTGWSLQITSVPEPATWAMLGFGTVFGGWHLAKRRLVR